MWTWTRWRTWATVLAGWALLGAACWSLGLAVWAWTSGSKSGGWMCGAVPVEVGASVACFVYYVRLGRGYRPGVCSACGYDRAGLEDGARCPECGAEVGG